MAEAQLRIGLDDLLQADQRGQLSLFLCLVQQGTESGKQTRMEKNVEDQYLSTGRGGGGGCTLRHGIQNSMEAILACHPALCTK